MNKGTPSSSRKPRQEAQQSIALTMLAAVFLLAQILFGSHYHPEHEHRSDESGIPAADCVQCLAATHHPADLSPAPEPQQPEPRFSTRVQAPTHTGELTAIVLVYSTRAPPASFFI